MPPKGSQLLNRVLARENDDGRCSSSESENGMDLGLTHLAATASAGLRMEMEMLRESRSREKADGVDRDACIVDRQQFFNTQIGVGYQHKKVIRQRTVNSSHLGQQHQVVDMSVAPSKESREEDSDGAVKSKRRKKDSKTKSKRRKKEKKKEKDKKDKKDGRGKKSTHRRKTRSRRSKDDNVKSAQERKRKKKRKRDDAREVQGKSDGASSFSSTTSSNSAEESDDSLDMPSVSNMAPISTPPEVEIECPKERARLPLQRLRDIIEDKIRGKTRSKARGDDQLP